MQRQLIDMGVRLRLICIFFFFPFKYLYELFVWNLFTQIAQYNQ